MSFFDKINDVMHVNDFKQFLHIGSNKIFVASIIKSVHSTRKCLTVSGH